VDYGDATEAAEVVLLADLLLRILKRAIRITAGQVYAGQMWWRPASVTTRSWARKSRTAVIRIALILNRTSVVAPAP
jgi:hypothetical protein